MRQATGHVYVFAMGERVKVGRSGKPWRRLEAMRREYRGLGLAMVYCTDELANAVLVEFRVHQILARSRMDAEWFTASADEAEAAVRQAVKDVRKGWRFPAICVRGGMPSHRDALAANQPAERRRMA